VELAINQIVSASDSIRALMPNGIQPPVVVQYNASSVPVLQLSLSFDRMKEQQLYDYAIYRMRQALAPIQGIILPTPHGGKHRQIMVDLDPDTLRANGLTPNDVVNAESLTEALNRMPVRQVGATAVSLSNVDPVRNGWAVQQNVVRDEGRRSVLLTISKNGDASTQH